MKVLVLHNEYRSKGGEDEVFRLEVELLKSYGHDVEVLLFANQGFAMLKFLFLIFNPISFFRVCRAITKFGPDIIHVHNWFYSASPSVFVAAWFKGIPCVHTMHNFRILCPSAILMNNQSIYLGSIKSIFPIESIARKVYKDSAILTFWILVCTRVHYYFGTWRHIDRLICLTEDERDLILESYLKLERQKIVVKANFVNDLPKKMNLIRGNHYLYVGRLSPEKGIQLLVNAFGEKSNRKLRIVGEGPLRNDVQRLEAESSNINYLGYLDREAIIEEMRSCSALVVPSICYEPFGLVIPEAFACGTPVIATIYGAPGKLVRSNDNGLLFDPYSLDSMNAVLGSWDLLADLEKMRIASCARREFELKFDRDVNYGILFNIYKEAIKKE